jgi:hypothetical protein
MSLTPASTAKRVGHQPRERRLADARRTPQDHRVRLAGRERDGERLARGEQVPLTDHVADRARTQPLGERRRGIGGGEEVGGHG